MAPRRVLGLAALAGRLAWRFAAAALPRAGAPAIRDGDPAADLPIKVADKRAGRRRPRLLLVMPYPVHPMLHGGAVRVGNLIRRLAAEIDIYLVLFSGGSDEPAQRRALAPFCRGIFVQRRPPVPDPDPWGRRPSAVRALGDPRIAERLAALAAAHAIDVVQLESTELGQYLGPYPAARTVLTEYDLGFEAYRRRRRHGIGRRYGARESLLDWLRSVDYELAVCRRVDQVHVMSRTDGDRLARLLPDGGRRIRVVPNGVDTARYRTPQAPEVPEAPDERAGVLFVGSFPHLPNRDALDHLVAAVWPRVRAERPDARLTVAGAQPPASVRALDGRDGIRVAGEVPDLAPLYHAHQLLVVAVRAGSGTRLKILEALASGLPVATTSIGAEGLPLRDGEEALIADGAGELAAAILRLLADDALAASLAARGRRLAERFDWDAIAEDLAAHLWRLAAPPPAPPPSPQSPPPTPPPEAAAVMAREPEVSVIVPAAGRQPDLAACLAAIGRQACDRPYEVLVVDGGIDADGRAAVDAAGARLVAPHATAASLRDAGAARARGRVLVFLDPRAEAIGDGWLAALTAPFFAAAAPPSAVQGGIVERARPGAERRFLRSTRESVRWRAEHGDVDFSLINAALRREVWSAEPFGADDVLAGRRWQWRLEGLPHLILPCDAAEVFYTRPWGARSLLRQSFAEGRSGREIGSRYRLRDLVVDLRRPPMAGVAGRVLRPLRPLGLLLGDAWGAVAGRRGPEAG